MTKEDLAQSLTREFWPQIQAVLSAYRCYYTSGEAQSYTVIEIPQLELARTLLDFVGLTEPMVTTK